MCVSAVDSLKPGKELCPATETSIRTIESAWGRMISVLGLTSPPLSRSIILAVLYGPLRELKHKQKIKNDSRNFNFHFNVII